MADIKRAPELNRPRPDPKMDSAKIWHPEPNRWIVIDERGCLHDVQRTSMGTFVCHCGSDGDPTKAIGAVTGENNE